MNSREKMAHNYLLFRFPTEYILIFFPVMVGVIVNVFTGTVVNVDRYNLDTLRERQFLAIDNFLIASELTIIILISFFVCYRWASMVNDGSYGFWLSTGIIRRVFFFRTIGKITTILVLTQFLGITLIIYLNQIVIDILTLGQLVLAISANSLFLVNLAIFLSNRIRNPEFASLTYLTIMGFNFGFNTNPDSPLYLFFQSDLVYQSENVFLSVAFSLAISVLLMIISLRIHVKQDIHI